MKTLRLTLKKKWFDMILSGEKLEEYREFKNYWVRRLVDNEFAWATQTMDDYESHYGACPRGFFKKFDQIKFTNGYSKNAPTFTIEFLGIEIGKAKPEWSDNWKDDVFKIKLGKITLIKNV